MRRTAATGLVFWSVLAALVAAAVVWRTHDIRDAFGAAIDATHRLHTPGVVQQVAAWGRSRAALAESISALLAHDFARHLALEAPTARSGGRAAHARAVDPTSDLAVRFRAAMSVLARREGFVAGYLVDPQGVVLSTALDPEDPRRDLAGATVVDGRSTGRAMMAPWAADASGRIPTLAVPCGTGYCAEFRAPILVDGAAVAAVVLLAPVGDTTFAALNTRRAEVQTLRTSVLAPRRVPVDSSSVLAVVATEGGPGTREPDSLYASSALPAHVRRALRRPAGELEIDTAAGLHGQLTHYAVARVPELDWFVLREFDRSEMLAAARRALLIEAPILVALLVSVVALIRYRLRAIRARRDRELTRLRSDFVASTSHELRTPLAQIRMFAELLQGRTLEDPAERTRALQIIEKESSRLTILVDNLLNYTRLRRHADDATAAEAIAPVDVAEEVAHVVEAFTPLATERRVRVVSTVPPGIRARIDSLALRQVLVNYLENAVKYGPIGQTVTIGAALDDEQVRIWVDDQGPGVVVEEREHVWEAFRRGQSAEESGQGGSGIGLAVVRELALQYGGATTIEDAPKGGARFVARFPRG